MGGCMSTPDQQEQKEHSDQIDRELEEDHKKFKRECKILLLDSGESGKSTIVKQMKIIHQDGFKPEIEWTAGVGSSTVMNAENTLRKVASMCLANAELEDVGCSSSLYRIRFHGGWMRADEVGSPSSYKVDAANGRFWSSRT
ncbi:G-alpha-domain-containing protein [Agrocybe pediades]|nr:G-alpha-domain-containing protein [Agrocybe pediades]